MFYIKKEGTKTPSQNQNKHKKTKNPNKTKQQQQQTPIKPLNQIKPQNQTHQSSAASDCSKSSLTKACSSYGIALESCTSQKDVPVRELDVEN